jgi:pilus assembly protein CpaE
MPNLKVLIVESDTRIRQAIAGQIEALNGTEAVGQVPDASAAQRLAAQHRPDVVILELPEPPDASLDFTEWLRVEQPEVMVIGTATAIRPDLMRRAMRAGAQDLLPRPLDAGQLKLAIEHAGQRKAQRARTSESKGQVVAVSGVGGGIGTTTIATNIAVTVAGTEGAGPVVLADLDLEMGSVPCFLDLQPTRTFRDLQADIDLAGPEGLRQFLPRHSSGLYLLAGPQRIEDLDAVTTAEVARVLDLCRTSFPVVVVDTGHGFDERKIEVLDRADRIFLVTQLNVALLRSARRVLDTLNRLGYSEEKVKVVANRVLKGTRISLEDARKSLERPVSFSVPNDYPAAIAAIDSGVPVVSAKRSSRTAASLRAIGRSLLSPDSTNGKPSGGFKRLLTPRGAK